MIKNTTVGVPETSNTVFYGSESRGYGIHVYESIVAYATENKVDLETAGTVFGLTDAQKDLVKLMQARDLYKNGLIKQGNILLNGVENTPDKSEQVKTVLNEVRNKKEFYQYREVEKPKVLAFLKPGKRPRKNIEK